MKTLGINIPIITGVLLFLGYLNLQFYYVHFDIPIYHFINTGEIILSFLPIIIQVLIIISIYFLYGLSEKVFDKNFRNKITYQISTLYMNLEWQNNFFIKLLMVFIGFILHVISKLFRMALFPLPYLFWYCGRFWDLQTSP